MATIHKLNNLITTFRAEASSDTEALEAFVAAIHTGSPDIATYVQNFRHTAGMVYETPDGDILGSMYDIIMGQMQGMDVRAKTEELYS